MASIGSNFNVSRNKFDIPDFLSLGPPLLSLFGFGQAELPEVPNLTDFGLSKKDISSFINLRRALGSASIQRQGAQATRSAVSNLPTSLQTGTVPASIASGVQSRVGDQLAQLEGELSEAELDALFKSFQSELQAAQLGLQKAQFEQSQSPLDLLSLLPLAL